MKTTERYSEILEILKKQRFASVSELSSALFLSPSSIRRDLNILESEGLVKRNYGGVMLVGESRTAAPFLLRCNHNRVAKREIASHAASLLQDGMTVLLDDSSTAYYLLEQIEKFKEISVFTNNLLTAVRSIELGIKTYTVGGSSCNGSVVNVGSYALGMLDRVHADLCFFSAYALSDDGEISDCTEEATAVRLRMIERSDRRIFLCDSTKFSTRATHFLINARDVDCCFSEIPFPLFGK